MSYILKLSVKKPKPKPPKQKGLFFRMMGGQLSVCVHMYIYIFFLNKFIYLFIYFWLFWVFVSMRGLSLVAASGGHSSWRCAGLSLSRPLLLWSTGSRRAGSVAVAHGPSCSAACGILPDQGSNPCPLLWQVDSQPVRHQGSPHMYIFKGNKSSQSRAGMYYLTCSGLGRLKPTE